jgi:hypothetical protein
MRKTLASLVAVGVVGAFAAAASAQLNLWFDIRDNSAAQPITAAAGTPVIPFMNGQNPNEAAFNSGRRGDGQILRLNPVVSNNYHIRNAYPNLDNDGNLATGDLHLYADVLDDASGTGDVISSIGVDFNVTDAGAGGANRIASAAWLWDTANWQGTNAGVNNGASNGGNPPSWLGAKAVKVPVNASAQYDTTGGLTPRAEPYHLGSLRVTAGNRTAGGVANHATNSTFNVKMAVNDLLITRVFQTGGDAVEMVSFGYVNGTPEAAVSGSQVGNTSTTPDAVIVIQMKGDNNGNGAISGIDGLGFTGAANRGNGIKQSEAFLFNNNGGTGGSAATISGIDGLAFTQAASAPTP